MSILATIIPLIAGYTTITYCPRSQQPSDETSMQGAVRRTLWPILFTLIGVAWYYARAATTSVKLSTTLSLDMLFMGFTALVCWWLWLYICEQRKRHAFYVLILTVLVLFMVIKKTRNHDTNALLILTPVILWIFFMVHIEGKELYYNEIKPQGVVVQPPQSQAPIVQPEQAPPKDYNCRDNITEPFKVW